MIKALGFFTLLIIFLIAFLFPVHSAGNCQYGSTNAWFKANNGIWQNATAHPVLRRGEPFEIQIIVTCNTNLSVVYVKLHEFGTPVYEVLEGPTAMEQLLVCQNPMVSGRSYRFFWKLQVRENTTWVNGYAPLEIFVQFNKNDTSTSWVHFDIIIAFIVDEPWTNGSDYILNGLTSPPERKWIEHYREEIVRLPIIGVLICIVLVFHQKSKK